MLSDLIPKNPCKGCNQVALCKKRGTICYEKDIYKHDLAQTIKVLEYLIAGCDAMDEHLRSKYGTLLAQCKEAQK